VQLRALRGPITNLTKALDPMLEARAEKRVAQSPMLNLAESPRGNLETNLPIREITSQVTKETNLLKTTMKMMMTTTMIMTTMMMMTMKMHLRINLIFRITNSQLAQATELHTIWFILIINIV